MKWTRQILQAVLFLLITYNFLPASAQTEDNYCGTSFKQAREQCELACPTGFDFECTKELGDGYGCYVYTGCSDKLTAQESVPTTDSPTTKPTSLSTDVPTLQPSTKPSEAAIDIASAPSIPPAVVLQTAAPSPEPTVTAADTKTPTTPASWSPQVSTIIPATVAPSLIQVSLSNSQDAFCGQNYFESSEECSLPCPTGQDIECIDAFGEDYSCFLYTGCNSKLGVTSELEDSAKKEPTVAPTPIITSETDVYTILTLRNTVNRNMTADEEEKLKQEMIKLFSYWRYFQGKYEWSAENIEVWYQEPIEWPEREQRRELQEGVGFEAFTSTAVTLIISTWFQGAFTSSDLSEAIIELINTNKDELLTELQGQDEFPFFFQVNDLQSRAIEQITPAPVAAPKPTAGAETQVNEPARVSNGAIFGGIAGSALFICIAGIGLSYYVVKRQYQNKLEKTLNVESTHAQDLALSQGSDNASRKSGGLSRSSNVMSGSSSPSSSNSSISDDDETNVDIESQNETIQVQVNADNEPIKTGRSLSSNSLSSSSAVSALEDDLLKKIEQRRLKRATAAAAMRSKDSTEQIPTTTQTKEPDFNEKKSSTTRTKETLHKKNHWKDLKASVRAGDINRMSNDPKAPSQKKSARSQSLVIAGADHDAEDKKSKADHWRSLSKSVKAGETTRSKVVEEDKRELNEEQLLKKKSKSHWKTISKSIQTGEINRAVDRATKLEGYSQESGQRKMSLTKSNHNASVDIDQVRSKPDNSESPMHRKNNWKDLRGSMKAGDITRESDHEPIKMYSYNPQAKRKEKARENWSRVRNSVNTGELLNDVKSRKSSNDLTELDENYPEMRTHSSLRRSSKSEYGDEARPRRKSNCDDDVVERRPSRDNRILKSTKSKQERIISREDLDNSDHFDTKRSGTSDNNKKAKERWQLIKQNLASSDCDFRKSEMIKSDDMRKSRRSSQDDDLLKEKKGSSANLRRSSRNEDGNDLRTSKRKGNANPRRRSSM